MIAHFGILIIEGLATHLPAELVAAGVLAAGSATVARWRRRRGSCPVPQVPDEPHRIDGR